jgi:hypothetical protein
MFGITGVIAVLLPSFSGWPVLPSQTKKTLHRADLELID